ncbi:hypothetical protein M5689_021697 [Euphorbia peplus]|nr:hypothetical protein M5689_021697 [Euphorbia peplus]
MVKNDGLICCLSGQKNFRFDLKGCEILMHVFLLNKVKKLPCDHVITNSDLYDGKDEWKGMFEGMPLGTSLYFVTKLRNRIGKGQRIWKETRKEKMIYDGNKQRIGMKKRFNYFKSGWLMDEYSLDSRFIDDPINEYVVCHIKRQKEIVKSKVCSKKAYNTSRNSNQDSLIQDMTFALQNVSISTSNNGTIGSTSDAACLSDNNDQAMNFGQENGSDSRLWMEELEGFLNLPAN